MDSPYFPKVYRKAKYPFYVSLAVGIICIPFFGLGIILLIYYCVNYKVKTLTVEKDKLVLQDGFLTVSKIEIPYAKINSVTTKMGFVGRQHNYGDIIIYTGNDTSGIGFKEIENPEQIKKDIEEAKSKLGGSTNGQEHGFMELEKLAELKEKGIITEEEFSAKKKQILGL